MSLVQQKVQTPKKFGGASENLPQHTMFFLWNCKRALKKDGQFEEHFQEHLGDQYHCEQCNKLFTSNHKLIEHTRHMHKGQHTCEICAKKLLFVFLVVNVNKI